MATRSTARRRPRVRVPHRKLPEELELKVLHLIKRLEATSYAASTITLALIHEDMGRDREFAVCLEKQVSDELDRVVDEFAQLLRRYADRPYTALIRDSMLGSRGGLRLARSQPKPSR